ncbi:MAG: ubiquitin-like small modifier protein 1 [Candidatus Odinarchaeia archaeon]
MEKKVKVKLFALLREIIGKKEVDLKFDEEVNVKKAINTLVEKYKELKFKIIDSDGKLRNRIQVLVNGRNIVSLEGLSTKLKDGDTLAILPAVGGGA